VSEPSPVASLSDAADIESGWMAFTARADGYFSIYVGDPEAGEWHRAIDIASVEEAPSRYWLDLIGQPSWAPDGERIAFTCIDERGMSQICTARPDGSDIEQLTDGLEERIHPDWSPDGSRIVFSLFQQDTYDVAVMDADGTNVEVLVDSAESVGRPQWSPDGRTILFASLDDHADIFSTDPDGSNSRDLTRSRAYEAFPSWSPDGKHIAFMVPEGEGGAIWTIRADGSGRKHVLSWELPLSWPTWSPDGRQIAFTADEPGGTFIARVDAKGGELVPVYNGPDLDMQPDWLLSAAE
jgi:Tol biopolymer transport system component